jgi:trigger factor
LKIETTPRDDHQVKVVAEFEPEVLEKFKHRAARKIANEAKIPGFRPGKAPYEVVKRFAGEGAIVNEAMELMIDEVYPEVVKESGIKPFGPGSLEEVVTYTPPTFAFVIPLEPEITLGDYRSVRQEYNPEPFDEKEVDRFFYQLRTNYATVEPAERPAQENDLVFITYSGTLTQPAEGEEAAVDTDAPTQVLIKPEDQPQEGERPFTGIGRQLIGVSAGDERDFTHTFADDYADEKVKGKEVTYHVKVQSVKSLALPELNDEFAQTMGEYSSFDAMRSSIHNTMETSKREEYDQNYFTQIVDKIRETSTVVYPPQALEEESEQVQRSIERDLARQKMDLETYLKMRKLEKDAFIDQEVKPIAITRLIRSLIMDEISRKENLKVDQKQLESGFGATLNELQVSGELPKMRKRFGDDRLANVVAMETASRLMNRQVLERLKAIATGQVIEEAAAQEEPAALPDTEIESPASTTDSGNASADIKTEEEIKE